MPEPEPERDLFGDLPQLPTPDDLLGDPEQWESAMAEIAQYAGDELRAQGLDGPAARRAGCAVAIRLCRELGGARFYWPRGDALDRAVRDLSIYAAHDGTVHGARGLVALGRQHDLGAEQVRRIVNRQRELLRRRLAGEAPESPVRLTSTGRRAGD